jgi:hypothetical protein
VSVSDAVNVVSGSKLHRRRNTKEKLTNKSSINDPNKNADSSSSQQNDEKRKESNGISPSRRNLEPNFTDGVLQPKNSVKSDSSFRKK